MKITRKVEARLQNKQEGLEIAALVLRVSDLIVSHRWFEVRILLAEHKCHPQEPELRYASL